MKGFQEVQGPFKLLSFVLEEDRVLCVCRCGSMCLWVWWADGWVWVLVDIGCKRVLNNLLKIEGMKGSKIRFLRHN